MAKSVSLIDESVNDLEPTFSGADLETHIDVDRDEEVTVLTLTDASGRNALSLRMRQLLHEALVRCIGDASCRAIVLTGSRGNFCAGGDVREMNIQSREEALGRLTLVHQIIRLIVAGPKPVVAAVEGIAAGGGISLLAGCDHVVAATSARLTSSFLRSGVLPDLGVLWSVSQRMGMASARTFFTLGRTLSAEQAQQSGLVDTVVEAPDLRLESIRTARKLAQVAPLTFSAFKQAFANHASAFDAALAAERLFQPALLTSSDQKEAVAAFLEKRQPRFTGN